MNKIIDKNMLEAFVQYLVEDEKSSNTIEKYTRDVKAFASFLNGREATKALALEYKRMLAETHAITGANSMIAAVNSFFKYVGWGDCCIKQFKLQRKVFCPEEKELKKDEYIRLVKAAKDKGNERLSLILQAICGMGIRVSELKYLTVEAVKRGEMLVNCKGKSRVVFIVSSLKKLLLKYAKSKKIETGILFITKRGEPLSRTTIWKEMKSLCKAARVNPEKVYPHNLRHLFAKTFYNIKKDIAKLADILGHTSINTTRIYITTSGEEHQQMLENMKLIIGASTPCRGT